MINEAYLKKLTPEQFREVIETLGLMNLLELSVYLNCSYRSLQRNKLVNPNLCYPIKIGQRMFYDKSLVDKYISQYPFLHKHKKLIYGEKNKSTAIDYLKDKINKMEEKIDKRISQ